MRAAGAGTDDTATGGEESVTLRIHCDYNEEHPVSQQLAAFCERVNENSNGTITIRPYYAGALGDYTTVFDEVAQGSIDMTFGCNSTTFGQALNIWNMPYLATTWDDAAELYAPGSYISDTMAQLCDEVGVKLLGPAPGGRRRFGRHQDGPRTGDTWGVDHDFLLRVPNADTSTLPMLAMGYRIQSINWSELFTALQTGVVDGFIGGHPPRML